MTRVAIVGAGLGGLTLALALARAGHRPLLFEQAPVLAEVGAGITISPNATRVLEHLGLKEAVERLGVMPGRQWTQHWQTGEVLRDYERGPELLARYGAGYWHLHRADLHAMLVDALEAAAPGTVRLDHRVVDVTPGGEVRFANGWDMGGFDVVVGADGVRSIVRARLFPSPPAHFTGQVAWRGIVPVERIPERWRDMPPGIHVGPGRLFMRYPVRGGSLVNYAAFVELEGWEEESWSLRSTIPELLGHFTGWHGLVTAIVEATPPDQLYKWALHAREPLPTWVNGHVTLLGDAAHAMLPFMGQGAGTSIEDGMVLARALTAYPPARALAAYEAARRERTAAIQLQSRLLGLQFQGKDPTALGHGELRNEEALGLFAYDATTVPLPA